MRFFDKRNCSQYIGKWCLYRNFYDHEYQRIFVAGIKENIIKYSPDKVNWIYKDVSKFINNDTYFFVSPLDNDQDDDISITKVTSSNDVEWKEYNPNDNPANVEGSIDSNRNCSDCEHEWIETVLTSYPPIYQRTCRKCGKRQHIPRQNVSSKSCNMDADWVDGPF